jgi:hypothetical protein
MAQGFQFQAITYGRGYQSNFYCSAFRASTFTRALKVA